MAAMIFIMELEIFSDLDTIAHLDPRRTHGN